MTTICLIGWNPDVPGSIEWLADDGYSTTRNAARRLLLDAWPEAEARAADCAARMIGGHRRWSPARSTEDLHDLQRHDRRPYQAPTQQQELPR